jgi:hypothetical protein
MVWDYDLSEYVSNGCANIFYELDPTYIDECHPNFPDCVNGQNSCIKCDAPDNPVLRVSGKVVTYSNNVNVLDATGVSVDENIVEYNVNIFPNPASSSLNFSSDYQNGKLSVLILNAQGQEVKKFAFSGSRTIDVSDFPSGVYFVKVLGNTMKTHKIVIY